MNALNHFTAASSALAADKHSAPTTHIWSRVLGTVIMLAVIAGIYLLMWRGWKKRQVRQADVVPLNTVPQAAFVGEGIEATYISTTSAGDWLDRIAVHGLGERSDARVLVAPVGILVKREPEVFIPADAVRGVHLTTGMAGKYLRDEGIVVITWQHGDRTLDTGVKPRYDAERDELVREIESAFATPASSATERPAP